MSQSQSLFVRAQGAILQSFTLSDLRQLLFTRLGKDLEHITLGGDLEERVFDLLRRAGREGWAQVLFDALAAARSDRLDLAALAQELRAGAQLAPPAQPRRGGPVPLQKPLRVQHFTGRADELKKLLADLQPGAVLTLCGPGGMGKSALAAEAVWRLAPGDDPPARFPDGVLFHTFYHQPQADVALEAFARAYAVDPRPNPQAAARLALASRKALLVLDGVEAADDLDAVLAVTGTCGVLITTRRHADAPADYQDIEPLPRDEGLQLLAAWAGKYADDAAAANDLVRLLGGLPLALFLVGRYLAQRKQAASEYVPFLQAAGLEALHFGDRPTKSVPLLLRRSLEQVSAGAQAAFGAAGVLALAPFAAEPVAAALEVTVPAAHRLLGELVDYGLLLRPHAQYQVTHALAHSYARTHAAPPAAAINRLALHYAALAERESGRGPAGFAVLDGQRPHLVAVQAAALGAGQWDAVREITQKARDYLDLKGYWTERITVVQAGLDAARAAGDSFAEMAFANDLGTTYAASGQPHRAIDLYERVASIAREIGDRGGEGIALGNLGNAYYSLGETRRAIEYHEQCLVVMREIGDRGGEGNALGNQGSAYYSLGETRRAIEYHEQALVIAREIGHRRGEGNALGNLGIAYSDLGETRRAIDLYEQYLAIAREIGDRRGEGAALGNLGIACYSLGETRRAMDLFEQQLDIENAIGDRRGASHALDNLGTAYKDLGETQRAVKLCEQAVAIAHEIGDRRLEALHSWSLGEAYERAGDLSRAIAHMQVRVAYEQEIGHPDAAADAQRVADLKERAGGSAAD